MAQRTFDDRPAVREQVPLILGLVGPSSSGKTFSALRLATGIKRVVGGEIYVIDTESRRSLHYAERFTFRHVPFGAPFGPLDYLAAIQHCENKGAKVVIVDSMSHEHEGPGGVLEMHEAEVQRLSGGDLAKAERVKMLAWSRPKSARRRLINSILQTPLNIIFCFRAKEKVKIERGKEPSPLGWMAIAGEEFMYEMTAKCLLLPGANGVPTWQSEHIGERATMKRPEQFAAILGSRQLDEDTGEAMAKWAAGTETNGGTFDVADAIQAYASCSDDATFRVLETKRKAAWPSLATADKAKLKTASESAARFLAESAAALPLMVTSTAAAE